MDGRKEKAHVVIFPWVGMGHLTPFCEFAKLMTSRHGFAITFITLSSAHGAYTESLKSSGLGIRFIELPEVKMDSKDENDGKPSIFELMNKSKGAVEHALRTLLSDLCNPVTAFITDLFCTDMLEVSTKLHIPSYILFTSAASFLCLMLHHPTMDLEVKYLDDPVKVPGFQSLPVEDFPDPMKDKNHPLYPLFLSISYRMFQADGILINTFQELESRSIQALVNSELRPSIDGICMPSLYPVGPLISSGESDEHDDGNGCLQWLDKQPASSVIFVSFGSESFLSAGQIVELALGLQASGQRFLWALRRPPHGSNLDLSALLPTGFEHRTKDRGLVVTSWVPQIGILAHPSTGAFLSHCGWNSVLESIWYGVPIIAGPLQADQKANAFFLVNDLKMAVGTEQREGGIVTKEKVEKAAREVIEGEDGKKRRERAKELKESAKAAVAEGGSSSQALAAVAAVWKENSWAAERNLSCAAKNSWKTASPVPGAS